MTKYTNQQLRVILSSGSFDNNPNSTVVTILPDNSRIVHDLEFEQSITITGDIFRSVVPRLSFKNCFFRLKTEISQANAIHSLEIDGGEFFSEFEIQMAPRNVRIIGNATFHKSCKIGINNRSLTIQQCNFLQGLTISGNYKMIELTELNKSISNLDSKSYLMLNDTEIDVFMANHIYFSKIDFFGSFFKSDVIIDLPRCEKFSLTHTFITSLIQIRAAQINHFFIDNVKADENTKNRFLEISGSSIISKAAIVLDHLENIKIENSYIAELNLVGENRKDSTIKMSTCKLTKLSFIDVQNRGTVALRMITVEEGGVISLINSDLGKMDLINCDWSKAILEFQNSKITEIFTAETNFPSKVISQGSESHSQTQLAFGQLQIAAQKQGDTVRTLDYHSRELRAHYNNIKEKRNEDRFTRFNLWLNLISNKFGKSWWRAIKFSICTGLIFFFPVLFLSKGFHFTVYGAVEWDFFDAFIKFMNPLRTFETKELFSSHKGISPGSLSYLFDLMGRIFVAFGYYQTIQAFRRYGRKI